MSKRQKRAIFYSSPLIIILLVIILVKVKLNHLEANAQQLAQMGQAAQKVLGVYREGVEKFDTAQVLTCFDDQFASERDGFWTEELQSERDGVRVYEWRLADTRPFAKADVGEQVARYLRTMSRIEESKFKLDSVEQISGPEAFVIRSFLWVRGTRQGQGSGNKTDAATEAFETQVLFRMWLRAAASGGWKIARQELIRGTTVTGDRNNSVGAAEPEMHWKH